MSQPVTIAEGHTLTLTEQPVEKGPRFTVVCTCGDRFTADFAVCAQVVPTIHRYDLEASNMTDTRKHFECILHLATGGRRIIHEYADGEPEAREQAWETVNRLGDEVLSIDIAEVPAPPAQDA